MKLFNFLKERYSYSITKLFENFKISKDNLVHIGANFGQEGREYSEIGVKNVIWIEGNPNIISSLKDNLSGFKNKNHVLEGLISETDGESVSFHITSNSGSSTMMQPTDSWRSTFKELELIDKIGLKTIRFDTLINSSSFSEMKKINLMVIDVEGAEFAVIKSLGKYLNRIEFLLIEFNLRKNFEGGSDLKELDNFFLNRNFIRVWTKISSSSGDALYKFSDNPVSILEKVKIHFSNRIYLLSSKIYLTDFLVKIKSFIKKMLR